MSNIDSVVVLDQNSTRCRILGIDKDGWTHVYDRRRRRIVVVSDVGIDEQIDLDEADRQLRDWMRFVADRRGWWKEQWDGYRLSSTVFGGGVA